VGLLFVSVQSEHQTLCFGLEAKQLKQTVSKDTLGVRHGIHQRKMSPSKKSLHVKGLAGGVYQSLYTGDTVSHVGIFDPAFSIQYTVCKGGGFGLRQINTCRKVPLQVFFYMTTFCIAFYESY